MPIQKERVIRIQHPGDGRGFYTSDYINQSIVDEMQELGGKHPLPYNDSKLMEFADTQARINGDYIFGFKNWDQLRSWIYSDDWLKGILESGFQIKILDVENVHVGNSQCMWLIPDHFNAIEVAIIENEEIYMIEQLVRMHFKD